MIKNTLLVAHSDEWKDLYENEAQPIREIFGSYLIDIQHIGSTSIPDLLAKPIIDIAVKISAKNDSDRFIKPLEEAGYIYKPELSSSERHFFQKGNPIKFHLSISYLDQGGYWKRQLLFRDYLRTHPEARREYKRIKLDGVDKGEFVQRILALADRK